MTDWLGSMNDIVSFVADNKVDFVVGAGGLALASAAGIIPRVGLGRALTLGYRSYFQTTNPLSARTSEIKHLNDLLLRMERSSYIVVTGERGYGKTCLIDTTLNRQFGVVKISTQSGADKSYIVNQALSALTGVRSVAKRETVVFVEPMSREQIESIPELKGLMDFLKTHSLDEPVWKVFGGSPIDYLNLKRLVRMLSMSGTAPAEVVNQVKNRIHSIISTALNKNIIDSSAHTKAIITVFRENKTIKIPLTELAAMGLLLDYPNEVFREMKTTKGWFIVPSSPAIALIISENIRFDEGVHELRNKLFKTTEEEIK